MVKKRTKTPSKKEPKNLYFTHCSEKKDRKFEDSRKATTPDLLYTGGRITMFIKNAKTNDREWAIFSDEYGFVFPNDMIEWYNTPPDDVSEEGVDRFVRCSRQRLKKYEKLVYMPGEKPIHLTYCYMIFAMLCEGLKVSIDYS